MGTILPLSKETGGGPSLPPPVTLTVKEASMGKVKLIVHECFTGRQNPEDVSTAVFLSNAAALTESIHPGIIKETEQSQDSLCFQKGAEYGTSEE